MKCFRSGHPIRGPVRQVNLKLKNSHENNNMEDACLETLKKKEPMALKD